MKMKERRRNVAVLNRRQKARGKRQEAKRIDDDISESRRHIANLRNQQSITAPLLHKSNGHEQVNLISSNCMNMNKVIVIFNIFWLHYLFICFVVLLSLSTRDFHFSRPASPSLACWLGHGRFGLSVLGATRARLTAYSEQAITYGAHLADEFARLCKGLPLHHNVILISLPRPNNRDLFTRDNPCVIGTVQNFEVLRILKHWKASIKEHGSRVG